MIMNILKQERQGNRYTLEIEAPHDTILGAMDGAFKKLSKQASVPGFRKGKVPRSTFEKMYGREGLIKEAVMDVVNNLYVKAVENLALEVIDYPQNLSVSDYKENEPITFKCEVDVRPAVTLGKYKGLGIKKETPAIADSDVQAAIDQSRSYYSEFVSTETPSKTGDILLCNVEASIDGAPLERWTRQNMGLELGRNTLGKDADTQLTGHAKGETLTFSVAYPQDSAQDDIAGKTVEFKVELVEVRTKQLPELNEEFVQKISQAKTVDEYTADVRKNLEKQKTEEAENTFYDAIADELLKGISIDVQPVLVEREMESSINEFENSLKRSQLNLEQFLRFSNKSFEDFKEGYRDSSLKKIKLEITLDAIAKQESITVEEADLIAEIKKWNIPNLAEDDRIREHLAKINTTELTRVVGRRKAMDFVVEHL
jgi:trigger factor